MVRTRSAAKHLNGGPDRPIYLQDTTLRLAGQGTRDKDGEYGSEMQDDVAASPGERMDATLLQRDQLLYRESMGGAPQRMSGAMPVDDSVLGKPNLRASASAASSL